MPRPWWLLLPQLASIVFSAAAAAQAGDFPLQVIAVPSFDDEPPTSNLTVVSAPSNSSSSSFRRVYVLRSTETWSVVVVAPGGVRNDDVAVVSDREGRIEPKERKRATTSEQARNRNCSWATNGGPFHRDGTPVGLVVADGNIVGRYSSLDGVGFGITKQQREHQEVVGSSPPRRSWVMGSIVDEATLETLHLEQFVTGFDWLVYDGAVAVRNNTTGADRAPRTAIGIDREGRLLLVVADGCQGCLTRKGPTLTAMAGFLIGAGARYAINLDGGGSSVLVREDGRVVSQPTCLDVPRVCERAVPTVMCVGNSNVASVM